VMTRPALVVDGMSVFHSIAGPAASLVNGYTYSFVIQLTSAVKKFKPRGIFVCWEGGCDRRLEIHPGYKIDRPSSMNDTLRKYHDDVKSFLKAVGADQLHAPGYEADDIGAFLANTLDSAVLVSNDKDWLQLVRPGVSLYQRCRVEGKKAEKKHITVDNFAEVTGWSNPEEFVMGLCAMGDEIDKIDGISGIGPAIIRAYLLKMRISENKQKTLDDFFGGSDHYTRNRSLIELRDIREIDGLQASLGEFDEGSVKSLLEEFGFASMLKNFPAWVQPYKEAVVESAEAVQDNSRSG
jgi:5'-3' exonuclease